MPAPSGTGPWQPLAPSGWVQPDWSQQGAWPQPQDWSQPYGAWAPPQAWPQPQPQGWPQQPYGAWPQQAWPQSTPSWPAYQPAWAGPQPPVYWPAALPQAWQPQAVSWPIGSVPWGYTNPPAVLPVLEPPGKFHPPAQLRPLFSLAGRASPGLYAAGLILGLPAIATLLAYVVAATAGFKLGDMVASPWVLVEAVAAVAAVGLIAGSYAQGRQRRADSWQDYSGPSPFLMLGALFALVTAVQLPLEVALKSMDVDVHSGVATLSITLAYLAVYFGLVYFVTVRPGALSWGDIANPKRVAPSSDDWSGDEPLIDGRRGAAAIIGAVRSRIPGGRLGNVLVPLAMVLPLIIASNLMAMGLLLVLGLKTTDISPDTVTPVDALSRVLLFIAVAVVAPLGEELFFRGFAANAWARSIGRNSAILRASLFFAFVHVLNTPSSDIGMSWRVALFNFGARVPVAFALTWLYMRRRSILASGTLHAGYNGLITLISFIGSA